MSFDRQQVVPLPNHQAHSHHFAFYDSFGTTKHGHLDHEQSDILSHLRKEFYSDGTAGAKRICYRDCFKLNLRRYVDFCLDKRCNGAQFDEAAKFMGYSK